MKRKKQKTTHTQKATPASKADTGASDATSANPPTRRAFLNKVGVYGVLAALGVTGGWYAVKDVQATMREHDLSQIGNGVPTIVQIHDPQCSRCVALQRETREALCEFEGGELQYLVANITSADGRDLASTHGVSNVTLLFFDGDGVRRNVLTGNYGSEELLVAFRSHLSQYSKS